MNVTIRLQNASIPGQRAWLTMEVSPRPGNEVRFAAEIGQALGGDPRAADALPESQQRVLKNEIVGGILMARREAKQGCSAELVALGGEIDGQPTISDIPSIAYAVAAMLAVLHGLGVQDLAAHPRGGYGWSLVSVAAHE